MDLGGREATKDVASGDLRSAFLSDHPELANSDNNSTPVDTKPSPMPERVKLLREYSTPSFTSSIFAPEIAANNFEINPDILGIVQHNNFSGLPHEDPYLHLNIFLEICNTFKINGASDDAIRLRSFPFSLKGKARTWLRYLPAGSITTWNKLTQVFLAKYVPHSKIAQRDVLREFTISSLNNITSSIIAPEIAANNFEIDPDILGIVQHNNFSGLPHEDPYLHLNMFLDICNIFNFNGASDDAIRLRLFPFSLKGRVRAWLHYLPVGSITTWNELTQVFLAKYVPHSKIAQCENQED